MSDVARPCQSQRCSDDSRTVFPRWISSLFACLALCVTASAQLAVSSDAARRPPAEAWVRAAVAPEANHRWSEIAQAAGDAAVLAAEANRTEAMEGWLLVARWARLLGTDQRELVNRWISALNRAQLGHANMPRTYHPPAAPLSERLSREFVTRLLLDRELSRSLFDLLSPYDDLPTALDILQRLEAASGEDFQSYEQLALAIALVFDVPPPPSWPHGQVSPALLPRTRPDPVEAFAFWIEADRRRLTLHRLTQLEAGELKFVVDAAAPFAELVWVQQQLRTDFAGLPKSYDAVRYLTERADHGIYLWPGSSYTLPEILSSGGICIDQAYFASEVGKAKGVPTLLFRGAGLDGRHAWFGYLDARRKWQFDVGRYAEQKLVAGVAFDPQTWDDVNDHELAFLAEDFRRLPAYRQSRAWQALAQEHLRRGDADAAVTAAVRATNHEPRNVVAWEVLAVAERTAAVSPVKREATLRKAARALQRYPDLYVRFMREVLAVMRERGQVSAAEHEALMLTRKFSAARDDLTVAQAAEMLERSMAEDPPLVQFRVFESALRQAGAQAGMRAFDRLVEPFFRHTLAGGRASEAQRVLAITRGLFAIEPGSQFAREVAELEGAL